MAEVIIPVGFGSCAIRFRDSASGKVSSVTWGYELPDGTSAPDNAALIHEACVETGSLMAAPQFAAATYFQSVYVLEHIPAGFRSFELAVDLLGTRTGGQIAPPQVAVGMRKKGALVGKRQRGRIYLPNSYLIATDWLQAGYLTPTRTTQLETCGAVLMGELTSRDVPMYLLHTHPDDVPTQVLLLQPAPILRSQRRRLP